MTTTWHYHVERALLAGNSVKVQREGSPDLFLGVSEWLNFWGMQGYEIFRYVVDGDYLEIGMKRQVVQ